MRGEVGRADQVSVRGNIGGRRQVEFGDADFAAMIRPVRSQQARLGADEGDGVAGADAGTERPAGIGIEAGRAVQGEQRAGIADSQGIGSGDPLGILAGGRPSEADAEQSVDDQRPAPAVGNGPDGGSPRIAEALAGRRRIRRQCERIAGKDHAGREEALAQQTGGFESVAAVVAGAGQHQNRAFALGRQLRRPVCRCRAGPVHQRRAGMQRFDPAQAGAAVEAGSHGRDPRRCAQFSAAESLRRNSRTRSSCCSLPPSASKICSSALRPAPSSKKRSRTTTSSALSSASRNRFCPA